MGILLANRRRGPLVPYHRWDVGNVYPNDRKRTAPTDLSLDEAQGRCTRGLLVSRFLRT